MAERRGYPQEFRYSNLFNLTNLRACSTIWALVQFESPVFPAPGRCRANRSRRELNRCRRSFSQILNCDELKLHNSLVQYLMVQSSLLVEGSSIQIIIWILNKIVGYSGHEIAYFLGHGSNKTDSEIAQMVERAPHYTKVPNSNHC